MSANLYWSLLQGHKPFKNHLKEGQFNHFNRVLFDRKSLTVYYGLNFQKEPFILSKMGSILTIINCRLNMGDWIKLFYVFKASKIDFIFWKEQSVIKMHQMQIQKPLCLLLSELFHVIQTCILASIRLLQFILPALVETTEHLTRLSFPSFPVSVFHFHIRHSSFCIHCCFLRPLCVVVRFVHCWP